MRSIVGKLTPELLKHTTPKTVGNDSGFPIATFRELVEQVAKLSFLVPQLEIKNLLSE